MNRTIPTAALIMVGLLGPLETTAAPEISNVRVDYVYHQGFVVTWETDVPSTSRIEYGEGQAFDRSTPSPVSLRRYHRVTVSECLPDTAYAFRVVGIDENGDEGVSGPHDAATTIVPVFQDHTLPSTAGTDYPVGPEFEIKELRDVPWENLGPGDSVRIHWRPEPYLGKFLINTRGTPEAPIRIVGVPGPNGERPIIDGKNAPTRETLQYRGELQELSVVCVDATWGQRPGYILIQGLHITGAYSDYEFTNNANETLNYEYGAAAIRVQKGDNLVIRNCEISDCSNGLFAVSGELAGNFRMENGVRVYVDTELTREVLIEGNYIHGNGQEDDFDTEGNLLHQGWLEHQSYIQCLGVTYQYNRYGPMRPGARGSSLKDRSSGTVIRYNWIEGGAHTLDLVEAQEHWEAAIQDARYRKNYVYGNLFRVGNQGSIFQYGGDNEPGEGRSYEHFREGTLYFFHNTLYSRDEVFRWRTPIFDLDWDRDDPLPQSRVEMVNNVFHREGSAERDSLFQLFIQKGSANLGVNWINADGQPYRDDLPFMGSIVGWDENMIRGGGVPFATDTYLPGPSLIDRAAPIPDAVLQAGHRLEEQINPTAAGGNEAFPLTLIESRTRSGAAMDLGALEAPPPVFTSLRVEPEEAYVTAGGDSIAFRAVPLDQYGLEIEVAGSVTWNTDAGASGSIDSAGIFMSGEVGGPFEVSASLAGKNANATVTVFVPQSLRILTDNVEAEIGETVALGAELVDQSGGTIANAPVVWTLEGGSANFINAAGQLVAVEAGGPYRLTATFGALTAEGTVTVIRKRLPVLIEQVWPEPYAVDVPLDTRLELLFPLPASFNFTGDRFIRLYQEGVAEPVWELDPDVDDPNEGLSKVSFTLPTLAPGTTYYVLTDSTWVRINQEPWRPGDFEDDEAWRFTTRHNRASGRVHYYGDSERNISDVVVRFLADGVDEATEATTDGQGRYTLSPAFGSEGEIHPERSGRENASSGVTVTDVIRVRNHVLARDPLEGFAYIAGDVSRDNRVDVIDIVSMRSVILGKQDSFSTTEGRPDDLWRFLPAATGFDNPRAPFTELNSASWRWRIRADRARDGLNFVGIKLGDVDGSWVPAMAPSAVASGYGEGETRGAAPAASLRLSTLLASGSSSCALPIYLDQVSELGGLQFGLKWNADALEYVGFDPGQLEGFGLATDLDHSSGELRILWLNPSGLGLAIDAERPLVNIRFRVLGREGSTTRVDFEERNRMPLVVVDASGREVIASAVGGAIHVEEGPTEGRLHGARMGADGFQVSATGRPNRVAELYAADRLSGGVWERVDSATIDASGAVILRDPPTPLRQRFYRVRLPQPIVHVD